MIQQIFSSAIQLGFTVNPLRDGRLGLMTLVRKIRGGVAVVASMVFAIPDALRAEIRWVAGNLLCLAADVLFTGWVTTPRDEVNSINGVDVLCVWVTFVLPVLVLAFIVNWIWLALIGKRDCRLARRRGIAAWLLTCSGWLIPLCIDPGFFKIFVLMLMCGGARFL